jgi:transcription termination factor Rho
LVRVLKINGHDPQVVRDSFFEHLTCFPSEKFKLAENKVRFQLVLSICFPLLERTTWYDRCPTKTGKTMLLKEIANAIAANHRGIFDRFKLMSVRGSY